RPSPATLFPYTTLFRSDFPRQMGGGSPTSDFTAEVRFGLDWLQRMWDDPTRTFYYQVGIAAGNSRTISDHDIWRLPQADDAWGGDRKSTRLNSSHRTIS